MEEYKMWRERRKKLIIKPRLQLRIAFMVLVAMVVVLAVSFTGFYFFAVDELVKFNHPRIPLILSRVNYALLISFILSGVGVTVAVIYLTHKIAGPLYRLEKSMEAVASGDLTYTMRTRRGDDLKDLEASFNEMVGSLRKKVIDGEKLVVAPRVEVEVMLPPGIPPDNNDSSSRDEEQEEKTNDQKEV